MDFGDGEGIAEAAREFLGKYGVAIVLALAVGAVGYYFLVLAPKPVDFTVLVREVDGGPVTGAEVALFDSRGNPVGTTQITDAGAASFANVPPQQLEVRVDAGAAYALSSKSIDLSPPGQSQLQVEIEKKNAMQLAGKPPAQLANACKDRFALQASNFGVDEFDAELVADGSDEFAKSLSFPDGAKAVFPNETRNLTVQVDLPEKDLAGQGGPASLQGRIRIKKTSKGIDFNAAITPKLEVVPTLSQIDYSTGSPTAQLLTLSNNGKQSLENFAYRIIMEEKLKAQCGDDGAECFKIESLSQGSSIPAGGKAELVIRITPPGLPDDYFGSLLITGTCMSSPGLSIPIHLNLKTQA